MASSSETLQFTLCNHGDSILCKMNDLREEHRFCDIQLVLGRTNDSTTQPLSFHGHRVVLAASSAFLRDQFLLHEGQAELSVCVVSSARVAKTLLLSCYTGVLEVPLRELVSYLTAASALQMSQVVEKCTQALSHCLQPDPACLKPERCLGEKGNQQQDRNWPSSSSGNQRGKDVAQLSTGIQESNSKEERAVLSQPELKVGQEAAVDGQGLRQIREDRKQVRAKMELPEYETFKCHTLESEESFDVESFDTNSPLFHTEASFKYKLHPPAAFQDLISSAASDTRASAACKELMAVSQKQHEQRGGQAEEGNVLMESKLCGRSGTHLGKIHLAVDEPDSTVVQRPYLCRRCDRIFQQLQSYMGHLKEHRQFPCLVCGESFSQKSKLTRHIHVHTGVKPFRCPLCHKTFTQKALLQEHLHLHLHLHTGSWSHMCALQLNHKPGLRRQLSSQPQALEEGQEAGSA